MNIIRNISPFILPIKFKFITGFPYAFNFILTFRVKLRETQQNGEINLHSLWMAFGSFFEHLERQITIGLARTTARVALRWQVIKLTAQKD